MRKKFLLLIIFLLLFCTDSFPFAIEPARIELTIPPGRQKGRTVIIDNTKGNTPIHIKIYPQDIVSRPDGTYDFVAPGSTEWSCSQWIKVAPFELDIPAGGAKKVRVSVEVPSQARGGRYATLFFEAGTPVLMKGIAVNTRIGVMILVTVHKTEIYKARLDSLAFDKPKDIEVSIVNEGNVLLRPEGEVRILNFRGKYLREVALNPGREGVLPGNARKFRLHLEESLPQGRYTLKAQVDFGQEYLLIGELPIEVE